MFPILYLFIITFVGVMANRPASECYSVTNMYGAEFTRDQNAQASGPPGLPGKKGPGGQRGDRGLPGLIGTKGSTGKEGVRGPPGPFQNGIPGKKGDIGEGSPGPQGIRGPVGPKGVRGNREKGDIGPPGLSQVGKPGEKGEPGEGIIGAKGNVGASGPQGSPGVVKVGSQGLTGAHGVPGEKGIPGVAGPQGPQGPNLVGKKGEKGEISAKIEAELTAKYERLQALVLQPPKSCAELPDSVTKSGYYLISPALSSPGLSSPPFSVYCNFTQEGAYTIFEHDSEEEISVTKCEDAKCYSRDITYTNSIKHIREVIAHSGTCRQYLKYRCQGSVINYEGTQYASWLSYNGEERHNMGGSSVAHSCKCGITGTCLQPTDKCNCDNNSADVMTSDEGYLEDKDDLPVTNLKFGDTDGPKEEGWHTLGKLECVGVA